MRFLDDDDNGWRVEMTIDDLKALVAHASKDTARPHVNSLCIDPSHRRAMATDGHRIAVVVDPEAKVGADLVDPMLLSVADAKVLIKQGAASWTISTDGTARASTRAGANLTATFDPVKAQFPPVDAILKYAHPVATPAAAVGFDVRYLADLKLVVDAADNVVDARAVTIFMPAENDRPATFVAGDWTVVIMPMKTMHGERAKRDLAAAAKEDEAA